MKPLFILLIQIVGVVSAHSGVITGNGGNTLICADSAEVLDIAEARLLSSANFTSADLESRAFVRAEKNIEPVVFKKLNQWKKSWNHEAQFLRNVSLGQVTDSFHFAIPEGCTVIQTVIARDPLPGEKRYLVRADAFERLSAWQKSALQWHEVLYRQVIDRRQNYNLNPEDVYNSESTRKMVAALFADESDSLTSIQWAEMFQDLN